MLLVVYMWLCFLITANGQSTEKADLETLELVHVLFRHGDRTPQMNNLDPTNPYFNESNYDEGYGQLTQAGIQKAYNIGGWLRTRYNGFLDMKYNIYLVEGRSSDFNRTKATLQAVFAGLFPPMESDLFINNTHILPIPYNYVERERDKELFCFGCPQWDVLFAESESEGKDVIEQYREAFDYINQQTNQHITDILTFYYYYFGFEIQEQLNLKLPSWAAKIYPQPLLNITLTYYDLMFTKKNLKRMAGGYLMKKIVSDTEKKIKRTLIPQNRKMFLYSGHENNIASMLELFNLRKIIGVPPYGSQVLIELHNINGTYAIKIFYKESEAEIIPLTIPGYEELVPFNQFKSYLDEYINMDDSICKGGARTLTSGLFLILISCIWKKLYDYII